MPLADTVPYKAFRHFTANPPPMDPHSRGRVFRDVAEWFGGDSLEEKIARVLLSQRAVPFKEVLESFELHAQVRKGVARPVVADLCAGHGLTGVLFAAFDRKVEEVILVDRRKTQSAETVLRCVSEVAPWVVGKIRYQEAELSEVVLPAGAGVIGVHACGPATDAVMDVAIATGGPVGLLPCCHSRTKSAAPETLMRHLGVETATDVHRTYRLEQAGYRVKWTAIPAAITPMNRVILAVPTR